MQLTSPALAAEPKQAAAPVIINWNGQPFLVTGPICRSYRIVRTKLVPPELRRQYNRTGWPRHLVLMREFRLLLPGEEIDLDVATNADEAEDELPERIDTLVRDIGTYREGKVTWRARAVTSFVSASLRAAVCSSMDTIAFIPSPLTEQPVVSPAHFKVLESALKSGVVLRNSRLADALDEDERLLINLLIASHGDPPAPLSLVEIGDLMGVSRETIRRRRDALYAKSPGMERSVAAFRSKNLKGAHPDAIAPRGGRTQTGEDVE